MDFFIDADMAELADAPDLGSGGRPCRFKSCYPQSKDALNGRSFYFVLHFVLHSLEKWSFAILFICSVLSDNACRYTCFNTVSDPQPPRCII